MCQTFSWIYSCYPKKVFSSMGDHLWRHYCSVLRGLKAGGAFEMPCNRQESFPRWKVCEFSKKDHQKFVLTRRKKIGFPCKGAWVPDPLSDCSLGSLPWLYITCLSEPCVKGLGSCISFSGWLRDLGGVLAWRYP